MIVQISPVFLVLYEMVIVVMRLTNVIRYLTLAGSPLSLLGALTYQEQLVLILQDLLRVRVHQNMVVMGFKAVV